MTQLLECLDAERVGVHHVGLLTVDDVAKGWDGSEPVRAFPS